MLDLQPGIDLEEIEARRRIQDELDRARADVADRSAERDRGGAHLRAQRVVDRGRRRFLDDLLVPALDRALALVDVHDVTVRIAEDLDLDVARPLDVALEQQRVIAERARCLATRALERLGELGVAPDDAHALAAAAGRGLDEQRIADRRRVLREIAIVAVVTRHDRHTGLLGDPLRRSLVAERANHRRRRADEHQAAIG